MFEFMDKDRTWGYLTNDVDTSCGGRGRERERERESEREM
jgi:hypothetical protein